jgi:transcriptional regulator with XRE-family HTH domain
MRLREFRHARDLTVEEVGERLLCSATKISRLETGARRASLRDVRDLCQLYEVADQAQVAELMELASLARERSSSGSRPECGGRNCSTSRTRCVTERCWTKPSCTGRSAARRP